jgi:hypothetical protein
MSFVKTVVLRHKKEEIRPKVLLAVVLFKARQSRVPLADIKGLLAVCIRRTNQEVDPRLPKLGPCFHIAEPRPWTGVCLHR